MSIKENGLQIDFCTKTGMCSLRYYYPIAKRHLSYYHEIKDVLGVKVDNIGNKSFAIYNIQGSSLSVISAFRAIQKQLKIISRTAKVTQLSKELALLQS